MLAESVNIVFGFDFHIGLNAFIRSNSYNSSTRSQIISWLVLESFVNSNFGRLGALHQTVWLDLFTPCKMSSIIRILIILEDLTSKLMVCHLAVACINSAD